MSDRLTTPPKVTRNNLKDIIDYLNDGDYVVIHDDVKYGRYFHQKCPTTDDDFINNNRVIYVNVNKMPGLLDEGEWEWYIKSVGHCECTCNLKTTLSDSSSAKYKYFLRI